VDRPLAGLGLAQKSLWEVAEPLARGALVTVLNDFEPEPATLFRHPSGEPVAVALGRAFRGGAGALLTPNLV
jgi:hypothetical protein